jgi:hypothetical protein
MPDGDKRPQLCCSRRPGDCPPQAVRVPRPGDRGNGSLALVDELARANAPGSSHPKRCLDVEKLLGKGIDVYTTVNILPDWEARL